MITVKDIVRAYLEAKGFDGLCNFELECGCRVNDLEPCEAMQSECQPGRQRTLTQADADAGYCTEHDVASGFWIIEAVQDVSKGNDVKPKMFHGEVLQPTDSQGGKGSI